MGAASVRVGVGGWTFEPWRETFYPAGWPRARELEYASRQLSAIEVNGTYYSTFKPSTYAKWRDETPDGFVFTLKAHRFATNRRVLAEAGESVRHFVGSGLAELGSKLGPIVWQFAPTKRFEPADFGAFLALLPSEVSGVPLRHAMDVRHDSFRSPEYLALARRHGVATVFTESADHPPIPDLTADFVYLRVMRTESHHDHGLPAGVLDGMAECALLWCAGGEPQGLPKVESATTPMNVPRDVFAFFISGAKERAPAAALALRQRVG